MEKWSWYNNAISKERFDSIIVETNNITLVDKSFYVAQSTLAGCESERKELKVRVVPEIESRTLSFDTCANTFYSIADIALKKNIVENIDTLWVGTKDTKISLTSNIAKHGGPFPAADLYIFVLCHVLVPRAPLIAVPDIVALCLCVFLLLS